jgi:short-subunit dehydrogenase
VDTVVVDLSDDEATDRVAAELAATHPEVTLLINNAGVALGGRLDQVTLEEFDWVMAVNFRSVVRLTHALLPALKAHPGAHLVNVSSVFGIFAPAGQAAYSASKFAVRGFSEAVRHELAENGVGVTVVHPGGIKTRIAESARTGSGVPQDELEQGRKQFAKLLTIPAADAAAQIVEAIEKRRPRLLIGWSAKVPDVLVRLMPGSYWRLIARRAGRSQAQRAT